MKYSVIIPCYNEEKNIRSLIKRLEAAEGEREIEYIMVENGSKDATGAELEEVCTGKPEFKIVYVKQNWGYGYGLIKGMKAAEGDYIGWLHADLQVKPEEMMRFVDFIENHKKEDRMYFLKGLRKNRTMIDHFFTAGMTVYVTVVLQNYLYDIGAIPVLFHRDLLKKFDKAIPYDFSIETYVYDRAKRSGFRIKRFPVQMAERKQGKSSWDRGISSKFKQSGIIMKDIIKIRKGEAVR